MIKIFIHYEKETEAATAIEYAEMIRKNPDITVVFVKVDHKPDQIVTGAVHTYRTVKPIGNTCHVTVSKSMQGERVVVLHEDIIDEIRDCVMASIMLIGDKPSTALLSICAFSDDDMARFMEFYEKYVKDGGSINNELAGPYNNEIQEMRA